MSIDDKILNNEQWVELSNAITLFDENGDRTVLNRLLVSTLKNIVESLDDDSLNNKDNDDVEREIVITLIESELAELTAVDACPRWCCRHRRIQPFNQNSHKFSDYLINIARAKSFDKDNTGFLSKEILQRIFAGQLNNEKMAELLQFVEIKDDGSINYQDFATMMLITRELY